MSKAWKTLLIMTCLTAGAATAPPVFAQGLLPGEQPMQSWREHSAGMSPNAALAFYRLRHTQQTPQQLQQPSSTTVQTTIQRFPPVTPRPRRTVQRVPTNYPRPIYAIPAAGFYVPHTRSTPVQPGFEEKPFANTALPPNAVDLYWPMLMQARKERDTGLIIWQLP